MTRLELARNKVEYLVADHLHGDWSNIKIRFGKITYNVVLMYGTDQYGKTALIGQLSIPDFDTAVRMSKRDYDFMNDLNDLLLLTDFEHYY